MAVCLWSSLPLMGIFTDSLWRRWPTSRGRSCSCSVNSSLRRASVALFTGVPGIGGVRGLRTSRLPCSSWM
jgi:hypothetical protein